MKRTIVLLGLLPLCARLNAQQQSGHTLTTQQTDSIREERIAHAALLYPRIRQFSITHEEQAIGNIHSKLYGNDFFEGKFRMSRTRINMNVPIFQREKSSLSTSLGVVHQFFYLSDANNYLPEHKVEDMHTYIPMITQALTYVQQAKIFGKQVSLVASVGGLFTPSYSKTQFTFTGVASFPIIRKENTSLMAGAVVMIDPSSPVPAFLFLNYYHKFRKADLDLIIDLPQRIALRKELSSRFSLALAGEMVGSNSFFEFEIPNPSLPQKMTFSSLEIKSGLTAEYRITKKTVLSVSGGMNSTLKSRILENNAKPDDYFISNKHQAVPYVQVGLSVLPFWKGLNL